MSLCVCKIYVPQSDAIRWKDDKPPSTIKNEQDCDVVINLEIVKEIPSCVLLNEWFDVKFSVTIDLLGKVAASDSSQHNSNGSAIRRYHFIELGAVLYPFEDSTSGTISNSEYKLVVDESCTSTLQFPKQSAARANAKFRCKIVGPAATTNNPPNLFHMHIFNSSKAFLGKLKRIYTDPFRLVSHKLVLENYFWEDEGGRDSCIQAQIGLYSSNGHPVYGERVNLTFTLLYDTHAPYSNVLRQDILQVLGPTTHFISPNTAQATVRFRINDVSNNHEGQSFKIQISSDPNMANHAVPVYCPSVSVLSKTNKRQRTSKIATSTSPHTIPSPFNHPPIQYPCLNSHSSVSSPQSIYEQPGSPSPSINRESITQGLDRVNEVTRLREAMKGLLTWTEEVVNGLCPLQWQIIGYDLFPDGTLNYNCPRYNMSNPNECISKILSMHATSLKDQLRVLLNAVDNTKENHDCDQPLIHNWSTDSEDSIKYQHLPNTTTANIPSSFLQESHPKVPFEAQHMSSLISSPSQFPFSAHNLTKDPSMLSERGIQQRTHHQIHIPHQGPGVNTEHMSLMYMTPHPGHGYSLDIQHNSTSSEMKKTNREFNDLQEDVAFIVAMKYISPINGSLLGFPAYHVSKEVLGFYRESSDISRTAKFISILSLECEFGPMEKSQAGRFFTETMERNRDAVYSIKDWGTVSNLVDQVMVYDWKDNTSDDTISFCLNPKKLFL